MDDLIVGNEDCRGVVLFACSRPEQVDIFLPVARILAAGGYSCRFLTFERYSFRGAANLLRKTEFLFQDLGCLGSEGDWGSLSDGEQESVLGRVWEQIEEAFYWNSPSVAVVGNDVNKLEQIFIRTAEAFGVRTVAIQDHILVADEGNSNPSGGYGCELYCLWSEDRVLAAKRFEIGGRLLATGNPRCDQLVNWVKDQKSAECIRILLVVEHFSCYGRMSLAAELAIYQRIIRQLLSRADVEVILKLEGETELTGYYLELIEEISGAVSLNEQTDLLPLLKGVDALIAVSASVALEAAVMKLPVRLLPSLLDSSHQGRLNLRKKEDEFRAQIASPDFPISLSLENGSSEDFLKKNLREIDGRAGERVADALSDLLQAESAFKDAMPINPQISVVIEFEHLSSCASIRSFLRPSSIPIEIVAVDRSRDGAIGCKVEELISDSRLRVLHLPQVRSSEAVLEALTRCSSELVLRCDPDCVLLPGIYESTIAAFSGREQINLAFYSYALRSSFGLITQRCILPQGASLQELLSSTPGCSLSQVYAFRLSALKQNLVLAEPLDLHLIGEVAGSFEARKSFQIIEGVRYLSRNKINIPKSLQ